MCVVHFRSGVNVMPRCLCWATASIGWLSMTSGMSLVFPMFSNFVFSCPNLPFQLRAHCSASFTAPWSAVVFVAVVFRVTVSWISASSAYCSVGRWMCDGRSFLKTRNRTGPRSMRALGYTCGDGVLRRQGRANTNWNCSFRQEVWDPGHTRRCNSDHCKLVQEASVPNSVKRLFEVHEHCWWLLAAVQRSRPGVRYVNELHDCYDWWRVQRQLRSACYWAFASSARLWAVRFQCALSSIQFFLSPQCCYM